MTCATFVVVTRLCSLLSRCYGGGAGNTVEKSSKIFSRIQMR